VSDLAGASVEHLPLLAPGANSASTPLNVYAPFDHALLATVATADENAVEQALTTAYRLFRNRDAWLSPARRIAILEQAALLLSARAEQFALTIAREGGKPLIDARVEVARAIDGLRLCNEALRTEAGAVIPMNINAASQHRLAFTQKEPIGVVVAVSAFNHPLNLIVHQAGPAVAAGCPVIVKPAETTPISCLHFVMLLREAGLPEGGCQALTIPDHNIAAQLVTDQRVGFFSFIGSARVGWMLRSKLAPGTRCALEHGGVAPVIVAADADLDHAIPLLTKGGFYHAGQVCVSVQRVFVENAIARKCAEQLAEASKKLKVGDPASSDTEVGPLIRPREVDRVHEWVTEAVNGGAQLLCGGRKLSDVCYEPTVLFDPPEQCRVSQQEIFGPVVCVYSYADLDAAIARANALPYAFQAAVFTCDLDTALHAYSHLDASAVMVNDHTAFRVDWMPFAGLRQSGLGVGGIPHTLRDMQIEKMLVMRKNPYL
jgi:acyl-CoA reductase-like NAD-dependent aldehyde dehydrogenase